MFGRPAAFRASSKVVGPDDLVQETFAAEDLIEQHLHVVHFAVIKMDVERAVQRKHSMGFQQTRFQKAGIIVERIVERLRTLPLGAVALAKKAGAIAVLIAGHPTDVPASVSCRC